MSNTLCHVVREFEVKLKSCFFCDLFMFILFNYQFLCNTWIELFYSKLLRVCVVKIYNLWGVYCMNDFLWSNNSWKYCMWKPTTKPSKYPVLIWCHLQCRVDNANLHTYKQDRTILPCCQCYVAISVSPDIAVEDISPL